MSFEWVAETVQHLRQTYRQGRTRPMAWRVKQLQQLQQMMHDHEKAFLDALHEDLGKPEFEAMAGETAYLTGEVDFALKHMDKWAKPQKVSTPLVHQPGSSMIQPEPLGVVLVISPWNYPIQLLLGPVIGAIAAGNCVVMKPSELAPASSAVMAKYIPEYLDHDCFRVIEGAIPETQALLEQRFDHILFTGSGRIGKIVMEAAAKHLTPVTLELGGKSPCIIDQDTNLTTTARRVMWGKFFNAGQTCIAPDYLLVHEKVKAPLMQTMRHVLQEFYGDDPKQSKDYARIINESHFKRLVAMLEDADVFVGGESDIESRYIAPTILKDVSADAKAMEDEIFGPILPVLTVPDIDSAIEFINDRPKPLALYVFSGDKTVQEKVLDQTSSGGVCVNDTLSHNATPYLPFGGVGPSGMGAYHGKAGFDIFSHHKSILNRSTLLDPSLRYPPYSDTKLKWAKRLL